MPFYRLIDVKEAKFCLSEIERSVGQNLTCFRVHDTGHYSHNAPSLTLVLAVEPGNPHLSPHIYGSIFNPRKWWRITTVSVNQIIFAEFLEHICNDIETNPVPGGYDLQCYFLWDNLSVHNTAIVENTLEIRPTNHSFVAIPRPPYQPKYAPIEYIFCEIACRLADMVEEHWTTRELRNAIIQCILHIGRNCKLNRTFRHCLETL